MIDKHFFGVPVVLIIFGLIVSALSTALAVLFNLYIFTRVIPARTVVVQSKVTERIIEATHAASLKPTPTPFRQFRIASPSAGVK